jgi:HK97 family phage prohead protease
MERALRKYLETNPILLFDHRYSLPAGKVTRAWIDDAGLHIEARLPRPQEPGIARHWWMLVKSGVVKALSIGGVWRRELINGINYLTELDLREISVAAQGVAYGTTFSVQAAKAFGDPLDAAGLLHETRMLALRTELALLERDVAELAHARR